VLFDADAGLYLLSGRPICGRLEKNFPPGNFCVARAAHGWGENCIAGGRTDGRTDGRNGTDARRNFLIRDQSILQNCCPRNNLHFVARAGVVALRHACASRHERGLSIDYSEIVGYFRAGETQRERERERERELGGTEGQIILGAL